jgi:hypothetical protein
MAAWLTYLKERFPLAAYLPVTAGLATSGMLVASGSIDWPRLALAVAYLLAWFFTLRLADELKDYDKDCAAHPDRPLPRGLLSRSQVAQTIRAFFAALILLAVVAGAAVGANAGILFLTTTAYLSLIYRDFFALGPWLAERPATSAVVHQLVLVPLAASTVAIADPEAWAGPRAWAFAACVLGAFFSYEVCRKLEPNPHPALTTYLKSYGRGLTIVLVGALLLLAAWGARELGIERLLWPAEGLLFASLAVIFVQPARFKVVEVVASLTLLAHLWGPTLSHLTGRG